MAILLSDPFLARCLYLSVFALLWRASSSRRSFHVSVERDSEIGWLKGVNYGNRFIVEEWMTSGVPKPFGEPPRRKSPFYAGLTSYADRFAMADVVDTTTLSATERMLTWLNLTIKKEHFQIMHDRGVNVIRLPCGYWNWVSFTGNSTPHAPESLRGQLQNLQNIASPADYRPYFDRVFEYANDYGMSVLLDLHGLPGSQNGEMHSGIVTDRVEKTAKKPGHQYFANDWNKQLAVEAVEEMARFAATKPNLHSLQVINEPHNIDLGFLKGYYEEACGKAQSILEPFVPCVVFAWTSELDYFRDHQVDPGADGTIWYDTHIYHGGRDAQLAIRSYWKDLMAVRAFDRSHAGQVLVAEWSLALHNFGPRHADAQTTAAWFVQDIQCFGMGSVFWNYDGAGGEWSFHDNPHHVDWPAVWAPRNSTFRRDLAPFSIFTAYGKYLAAQPDGHLSPSSGDDPWELWYAHRFERDGQDKVALMSWHLKYLSALPNGTLTASASTKGAWEEFDLHTYEAQGTYGMALQSAHGKWVSVSDTGVVSANASNRSAHGDFTVVYCEKEVEELAPAVSPKAATSATAVNFIHT